MKKMDGGEGETNGICHFLLLFFFSLSVLQNDICRS